MKHGKLFWRQTPPALFPGLLGLFGLALTWRAAAEVWDITPWIGEGLGAVSTVLFLFTFTGYLAKLFARPSVLWDDLKIGPARGAVSAGSMCAMLLSSFFEPYSIQAATLIWWFAVILHGIYTGYVFALLFQTKSPMRRVNPVLLLPFVGILVATHTAQYIGYFRFSSAVIYLTSPVYLFIVAVSILNARKQRVLAAQRSSFFIILAPPSVAALGAFGTLGPNVFFLYYTVASLCALALVPFVKWMTRGGFTPGWGAFTFPLTAFASLQIYAGLMWSANMANGFAFAAMAIASVLVPYVVFRTFRLWVTGRLTDLTRSAIA